MPAGRTENFCNFAKVGFFRVYMGNTNTGMSQAGGQGGRTPPQISAPSLLRPPRFLATPLTARPPRFSDLETCLLLSYVGQVKSKVEISQIFVAFSE